MNKITHKIFHYIAIFEKIINLMNVRLPKDEDIKIANGEDIARIMRKVLLRQNRLHRKKGILLGNWFE